MIDICVQGMCGMMPLTVRQIASNELQSFHISGERWSASPLIAGNAEEQERIDKARERRKRVKIVEEELARLGQSRDER